MIAKVSTGTSLGSPKKQKRDGEDDWSCLYELFFFDDDMEWMGKEGGVEAPWFLLC